MISTLDKRMLSIKNEMAEFDEMITNGVDETLDEHVISHIDLKGEKIAD